MNFSKYIPFIIHLSRGSMPVSNGCIRVRSAPNLSRIFTHGVAILRARVCKQSILCFSAPKYQGFFEELEDSEPSMRIYPSPRKKFNKNSCPSRTISVLQVWRSLFFYLNFRLFGSLKKPSFLTKELLPIHVLPKMRMREAGQKLIDNIKDQLARLENRPLQTPVISSLKQRQGEYEYPLKTHLHQRVHVSYSKFLRI